MASQVVPHLEDVVLGLVAEPTVGGSGLGRGDDAVALLAPLLDTEGVGVLPVLIAQRMQRQCEPGPVPLLGTGRYVHEVRLQLAGQRRGVADAFVEHQPAREQPHLASGRGHVHLGHPPVEQAEVDVVGERSGVVVGQRRRL